MSMKKLKINGYLFSSLFFIWMSFAAYGVKAETMLERQILNASMPHSKVVGGKTIQSHMVVLFGYLDGTPSNAESLATLKNIVAQCVAEHSKNGLPIKVQEEWPDYLLGQREIAYFAKNFSTAYISTWAYTFNALDCSLLVVSSESAHLRSSAGLCTIDLREKTTKGQCNWSMHRDALSKHISDEASTRLTNFKKGGASLPANILAQIKAVSPVMTEEKKTFFGIKCQVEIFMGSSYCIGKGGSFTPENSKMVLEQIKKGMNMNATNAALDISVSENVFAPHLLGGFRAINKESK